MKQEHTQMSGLKIVPKEGVNIPVEILESAIVDVAAGMRRLMASRLKRDAIVILLNATSKVGKRDIELILNNLAQFESLWLKPLQPKK